MVDGDQTERLRVKLGFEGCFKVDSVVRKGGLCFLWRKNNYARLITYSSNHIDLEISLPGKLHWRLTCYYGYAQRSRRRASWDFLRSLRGAAALPWVVLGDFNDLLAQSEKRGRLPHPNGLIEGFSEALEDCGLLSLPMIGYPYIWERGKGTVDWVEERLDRAVTGSRGFRFENAWLLDEGCRGVVEQEWANTHGVELQSRLARCGKGLKAWGGDRHHKFGKRIAELRKELDKLRGRRDPTALARFRHLDTSLSLALSQEEVFWKQRAKQHWLQGADRNTKFFYKYASHRKKKNYIEKLKDDDGVWKEGRALDSLVTAYYRQIFTTGGSPGPFRVDSMRPRVTEAQNAHLLRPFEPEEVRDALFSMGKDKSPGPDGMNPGFYQAFWDVIGKDVTSFVLTCLSQSYFPNCLNDANIVLIPKKCIPESVSDLRPIALCNVLYKVMAKMLANRMKPLLEGIISESQSAFLPGRLISDNVLIASEVGHYLRRKQLGQVGWSALKLDMAKAYDRMEWSFVNDMLVGLGFDVKWIQLLMMCIQTVRYRVLVNGRPSEEIVPTRGLRQGDPLSPYLFIICAEGLSLVLQDSQAKGRIHGCRVARGAPPISHLFFADDSLLFFKANLQETLEVKRCLSVYEAYSGQAVNYHKSSVSFSRNTHGDTRDIVSGTLMVAQAEDFGKYLGLPSVVGRNRRVIFSYIEQKLKQRFGSWNKRLLSRAGKEVLLKSVAQAMPTYTMSIYLLPTTLCASLERLMNRYWWGQNGSDSSIHWLAWDRMCKPKKFGGMGFKRLHEFNLALLAKQGWRLLTNQNSLMARVFKARYFPTTSFYEAVVGGNPSYVWRSIMASQNLLKSGCRRRIGNGRATRVWSVPWVPDPHNPFVETDQGADGQDLVVSDFLDSNTGHWNHNYVHHLFNARDAGLILQLPVSPDHDDMWFWHGDIRGNYSVKDGYKRLCTLNTQPSTVWNNVWKLQVPPKWKVFLWRALLNILPTLDKLLIKRVININTCPSCGLHEECVMHLFCTCPYALKLWQLSQLQIPPIANRNFVQWAEEWLGGSSGYSSEVRGQICGLLHTIWAARNAAVWDVALPSPSVAYRRHEANWAAWTECEGRRMAANGRRAETAPVQPPESISTSFACFIDAGFHGPQRAPAFGFVVFGNDLSFVAAANGPMECPYDPLLAETMAMCEALSWLKDHGYSGTVVCYVNREANLVAHSLSKHVDAIVERSVWRDVPPTFIEPLLANTT
ncbi:PREDICTED: uncharacterized protein LOC109171175 [Ipomoea nil]|uniref:uncharacterized protein LOC109171175 n=1 Tax=Ipomoea nil TaxID=35883 RepID=UPI000901AACB|nr:PREDICTED: uncharacterized protein LOC109171175 [Ipomoea nil]